MSNSGPESSPSSPVAPPKKRLTPAPPSSQSTRINGATSTSGRGSRQQHSVVVDEAFVEAAGRCGISLQEMQPQTSSRDLSSRPDTAPHASEVASSAERRFYHAESLRARKIRMVLEERSHMLSTSPTKAPRPHPPSTLQPPPSPPATSPPQATLESNGGPQSVRVSQTRCLERMIYSAARRNQMRQLHSARTSTVKQFLKQQENSRYERAKNFDSKVHADSTKIRYDAGVISVVNEVQRRSRSAREDQLKHLRELQEAERLATELSRLQSKEDHINTVRERHAIMLETKQALLQRKHDNKLSSVSTRREQQLGSSSDRTRSQEERIERKLQVANAARAEKLERVRGDAASVRVREEEAREKARLIEKQRKREVRKNIKMKAIISSDHQEFVSLTKNLQLKQRVETSAYYTEIAQSKRGVQEEILLQRLDENEQKIQLAQEQRQRELDNVKAALAEENNMKDEWRRTLAKRAAIQQAIRSEEKELAQQEKLEAAAARRDFLLTL